MGLEIMIPTYRGLLLCGPLLVCLFTVPATREERSIGDWSVLPEGGLLVAARVKSTVERGELSAAMLEITHVYAGRARPSDMAFFVTTFQQGGHSDGSWRIPTLREGEQVIWAVRHVAIDQGEDANTLAATGLCRGVELPGRASFPYTRFTEVRKCPEAVEEVWRLKPRQRLSRLVELSRDVCPEVAAWAAHTIARSDFSGRMDFLRELVRDPRVTFEATVVADEELW